MAILDGSQKADKTYTVQDFISMRDSDEITYYNYSIFEYLNGIEFFVTNLLYDYEDELNEMAVLVTLTDRERAKYRYKPYLLGYDLYGAEETEFILLMLNGIIDPKEFDFKKIKAIRPSDLYAVLGRIQSVNETYLNNNRSKLQEDIKNNDGCDIWEV